MATPRLVGPLGPEPYARLVEAGFEDPYADEDGRCTFCSSNPLNAGAGDPDQGALIDPILFSGLASPTPRSATRVFDQPIQIEVGGSTLESAHSDHYGVQVTLTRAQP